MKKQRAYLGHSFGTRYRLRRALVVIAVAAVVAVHSTPAAAVTRLKNICRVKGQEQNVLTGVGLIVGLNGTGEANDPLTMRAIARAMEIMGTPLAMKGAQADLNDIRKLKNSAMVMVTATVPATGARRGDQLDCYVSALGGKSLEGGRLAFAALQGPNTLDRRVFALCQGQVTIDDPDQPMVGLVHGGCKMEADVKTPFYLDGHITLILDKNHANFQTADIIAEEIERKYFSGLDYGISASVDAATDNVNAIDAAIIQVRIPEAYRDKPVGFAAELLDLQIYEHEPEARVTINSRAGSIVISGDVEIGDVLISHKNVFVESVAPSTFAVIDVDKSSQTKLDELVNQLNALKVPTEDMIEIIRGIEQSGKLHGRLIIN